MLNKEFEKFVKNNDLFSKTDRLLLALSGGSDSVVLFHLLKNLNYKFAAAHCNFNLRNEDSDNDETFVKKLCRKNNIQLFIASFDTLSYARSEKLSVEEAARKLRYEKFEEIRKENRFSYILTAHHLDDKIETFFINLTKGTGIKGLRSIKAQNKKLIRPLLFAKKEEIDEYCIKNKIKYRTDQSNYNTDFLRNKFRHSILPEFREINPKFKDSMQKNFRIFSEQEKIYDQFISETKNKLIKNNNNLVYIDLKKLLNTVAPVSLLFEIIRSYGFTSAQSEHIIQNINNLQTGKHFFSKTHRVLKTPEYLIIDSLIKDKQEIFYIEKNVSQISFPIKLSLNFDDEIPGNLLTDQQTAYLDADKISFPLIIRSPENADYFYPFGMKGKKLLSDFFTDKKINSFEREKIRLLTTSKNEIIWIIGHRTDDRFKIQKSTKNILIVKQL